MTRWQASALPMEDECQFDACQDLSNLPIPANRTVANRKFGQSWKWRQGLKSYVPITFPTLALKISTHL